MVSGIIRYLKGELDLKYFLVQGPGGTGKSFAINRALKGLEPSAVIGAAASHSAKNTLKDFLGDMLNVGSKFLCNNLDFLKLFMLGCALNKNILSGLLVALLLSWLDRFCKGFTPQESAMANPLGKLGQVIPNMGTQVTSSSAFSQFSGYYSDFIKASAPLGLEVKMPLMDAVTNIKGGDISSVLANVRGSEMSYADRNSLIGNLKSELASAVPGSIQHSNLLKGIGDLKTIPLISTQRRDNAIRYENLGDKFGSYIKNLGNTNLQTASYMGIDEA
jgi:hypothetical protein